MGFDAFFEPVEDGPQVQVVGLDVPEVPLDVFEVLVGGHHGGAVQFAGGDRGAQDVEPVQGGFGVDLGLPAGHGQAGIGDGEVEVLGGLVLIDHLPASTPIVPAPVSRPALGAGDDGFQQLFGGGQQVFPLAGPVGGQDRVAAGDQPLAGVVVGGDLGEVLLVEQAELEGPSSAISFLIAGARSAVIQP